ncbi:beta-ketoacyl-ACP synthase II [Candidatus Fermentibacteria bacterium]|nr:beta-ketoacyl-ACP synthase II [Candidatus Fermentibacteria bacterium]
MGAFTPIGKTVFECWDSAVAGRSGIRRITLLDPSPFSSKIAGEVKDYDPSEYLDRRLVRRTDRFTQLAIIAAREAYGQSGLADSGMDPTRLGTIIGSGIGGIETLERDHRTALERGPDRISPFFCPMMISNMACGRVAIDLNAKGINYATVTACASSGHAIATAVDAIRLGHADAIIAGGTEAPITMMGLGGFCAMKALSTRNDDPQTASRPFDKDRDGFVIAEGAAMVVLEDYEHARERGADIMAEVSACGMTCDAHHITAPAEGAEGCARSMMLAVERAGRTLEDVDYINAHGTSTRLNDPSETEAIKTALGETMAYGIPVSSTKSVTGHLLGAAGAMELIFTALAIKEGIVPPTATLQEPDEECDLDYVQGEAREADLQFALSNSLGFGGHNVTIAVSRV